MKEVPQNIPDQISFPEKKSHKLVFIESVIYSGIGLTEIGIALIFKLDKGPTSPAESAVCIVVGLFVLRTGMELRDKTLHIKRDKYGDQTD
jgi:hypothetical protein